jgi:hypothetical protein
VSHPVLAIAKIFICIDDEVERRLRFVFVALRGDKKKGKLSSAIEEATEDWLKKHSREISRITGQISSRS